MKSSPSYSSSLPLLFFLLLLTVFSCKKDPYEIGINLIPAADTLNIKTSDTATLIAYSELQDSIRSDKTSTFLLGSLMDPVFGSTTASFYTQFDLSTNSHSFGQDPVLDSVVLTLEYATGYGDTNAMQSVKVYELSQNINAARYYTNQSASVYPTILASKTFRPELHDSVTISGVKLAPHLRINLNQYSKYFGNKLLSAPAASMSDNTAFYEYMQGLYLQSEKANSSGGLVAFDPLGKQTMLIVYYHNQDVGDSLQFIYGINSTTSRFAHMDHNQYLDASPEFRRQVLNHDTTLGKNQLYLQGLGGVRVKIRIPHLADFTKSGPIAVNNAILVIKNVTSDTTLVPPPQLELMKVDSVGYPSYLVDESEGSVYFGGLYNSTDRTYSFRITQYIQSVLLGKSKNLDLYLTVNNPLKSLLDPNRIVVNGTSPSPPLISTDRLKFQIFYTKAR